MRTIELTDEVNDDEPVGYMVFCCNDLIHDYKLFCEKEEAEHFAEEQFVKSPENVCEWMVYPLWASHGTPVPF